MNDDPITRADMDLILRAVGDREAHLLDNEERINLLNCYPRVIALVEEQQETIRVLQAQYDNLLKYGPPPGSGFVWVHPKFANAPPADDYAHGECVLCGEALQPTVWGCDCDRAALLAKLARTLPSGEER